MGGVKPLNRFGENPRKPGRPSWSARWRAKNTPVGGLAHEVHFGHISQVMPARPAHKGRAANKKRRALASLLTSLLEGSSATVAAHARRAVAHRQLQSPTACVTRRTQQTQHTQKRQSRHKQTVNTTKHTRAREWFVVRANRHRRAPEKRYRQNTIRPQAVAAAKAPAAATRH